MWFLLALMDTAGAASADRDAVDRIARGEPDALAELYDRHGRLVYSLALRIVRDQADAEDVVQEVFSQVWRQASRFVAGRGTVVAWMLMLTRSRAIDRMRRRRARPQDLGEPTPIADFPDQGPAADEQLISAGRVVRMRRAMEALPLLQRIAIELAFYEGLTHAEIAQQLELPLGTVKTRIRQGLLKLRDRLSETWNDGE